MEANEAEHNAPVFIQTSFPEQADLDRWRQITQEEAKLAYDMTLRNELSGGTPIVRAFEARWRQWTGLRHAITVMNGSSALYCAFFGLGIGPGDEVICPVYTWICTIAPAVFLGARPVFAEIDPLTLQLDPDDVRRKITPRTRAIVAVHLWGNVCDMNRLMAISRDRGIPILEDCAHAHDARFGENIVGSIGQVGVWSLQGTKAVSAGEGGMLATNDAEIFERACLAGQVNRIGGLDLVSERYADYQPLGLGMKFRAHPLGIGIASIQFDKLGELNRRRKAYVETVEARLEELPGLRPVQVYDKVERGGYYAFPIVHEPEFHGGLPTAEFLQMIQAQGLKCAASPYGLLHRLKLFAEGFDVFTGDRGPLWGDYPGYQAGDFPVTEDVHKRLIFLPMLSDPVPDAVDRVMAMLQRAVDQAVG